MNSNRHLWEGRRAAGLQKMSLLLAIMVMLAISAAFAQEDSTAATTSNLRRAAAADGGISASSSAPTDAQKKKFTYRRRRNQEQQPEDVDVIFGLSIKEFHQILSSDVAKEFGVDEVDIGRVHELWEDYADFEFRRALSYEADYRAGKEGVSLSDVQFPFLLCSKKAGKSGLQRKEHIVDVIRYGLDPRGMKKEEANAAFQSGKSIFTIYNSEEMTCFGARLTASAALIFAELRDAELPILPFHSYMKIRGGVVEEVLRRAEESSAGNSSDRISTSDSRLEVILCAGLTRDELDRMGEKLIGFMRAKSSTESGKSLIAEFNKYADVSPEEYGNLPSRVQFWIEMYQLGIDSEQGCDDMLGRIVSEIVPGRADGESSGFYLSLGPPTEQTDLTTTVACVLSLISGIALQAQVCSVELAGLVSTTNQATQWIMQDYQRQERPFWEKGITGKGQVVGVSDSGLDTNNCYFLDATGDIKKDGSIDLSRRKVVVYDAFVDDKDDEGGHGTHVAGTVAGHKAVDGRTESTGFADGVARDAKLAFFDAGGGGDSLSIPGDKSRFLGVGKSAGARIHSASWGSLLEPYKYDTMSRDVDQYIFNDWNFLLIVAAGNNGSGNSDRTILSPAVGKNALTVGASQSTNHKGIEYLADFSSRGPTSDGRIKPDVVAPGQSILSAYADPGMVGECDPDEGITYKQGTSMATPATSGAAALVRQYFLNGYYHSQESIDPSGMLLKAVLINGAQEISYIDNGARRTPTAYYDSNQGFGRVSLIDSLPLAGSNLFNASFIDKGVIKDGEAIDIQMNISKAGGCMQSQMRTTLVWADPPGAPGCTKCLINDLDLSITKNSDPTVYYPNGRYSKDDRNNVERIIVDAEDGDKIFVRVEASNMDRPDQVFALIITGCIESKDYVGDSQPTGNSSNSNRNIIIIVCSVAGAILVIGICWWLCASRSGGGTVSNDAKRDQRRSNPTHGQQPPTSHRPAPHGRPRT